MKKKTKIVIAIALVFLWITACLTFGMVMARIFVVDAQGAEVKPTYTTLASKRTGLYKKGRYWYYGHKTRSALYDIGDVARDCFKEINGKFYYFQHNGRMLTHDTHYIDVRSRDRSVRYIYTPGTNKRERYSTRLRREQIRRRGRWKTVGMQYIPYGQMDLQP